MTSLRDIDKMLAATDRASFDALKHMLGTVEHPRDYAVFLITAYPQLARAVRDALPGRGSADRGYWIVEDEKMRPYLVRLGLVPVRERRLSNYGAAVRKWLTGEPGDAL